MFVVTNQSGVARGHYDEAAVRALHAWMEDQVRAAGGTIDDLRYCPFHPEAPLAGLPARQRLAQAGAGHAAGFDGAWEIDPARCLLIGDQPTDLAAAAAAGMEAHLFAGGDLAVFARRLLG